MKKLVPLALLLLASCTTIPVTPPAPEPSPVPSVSSSPAPSEAPRVIGVTVDNVSGIDAIVSSLAKLPARTTVRIVFDLSQGPAYYRDAVARISVVADIIGQPADSTYVEALSLKAYRERFQAFVAAFPSIVLWETGNEVNGDWLGSGVPAKIDAAHDVVKAAGKLAVLVPYWNTKACADSNGYWLDWLRKNVSAKVKEGSDYVLVSVYGGDCSGPEPTAAEIKTFYTELAAMFPNAKLGLGEIGGAAKFGAKERERVLRYYMGLPRLHERDVFFGGYWFFRDDMVPSTKPLWSVLNGLMSK